MDEVTRIEWRYLPICPECANGKHANCDRMALDEATDQIVPCACVQGGAS